ncbi:MAG: phenylalanine--tRNA ligase beta subunit-related protein [Proteobacteria bacterium]|nr:phenylalanine--tRNA ligase beta subunit-related protein [Pseudomonadota bacterium]
MPAYAYSIADQIFRCFPGYVRGVVIAHDLSNGPSPPALIELLREAEASVRARVKPEAVAEEPRIKSWRDAYRTFGAKPAEHRSSVEAMARRALKGDHLPAINALVDIGNLISLRHLLPAGAHAIDLLAGDIALRPATGAEQFVAFGSTETEHPMPGEIIFTEGDTVLTRRWTWRQGQHTLTLPESRAVEFNIDGLPPVTPAEVEQAGMEIMELVQRFCGGRSRFALLDNEHPSVSLVP